MLLRKRTLNDSAVSPVIAVILMVAITVVLAATVYVWVSGFGSGGGSAPGAISLSSSSPITSDCSADGATTANDYCKSYTVSSASSGLTYGGLTLTLDGVTLAQDAGGCATVLGATSEYGACAGSTAKTSASPVAAGDQIKVAFNGAAGLQGKTLRVIDANANSILATLTL